MTSAAIEKKARRKKDILLSAETLFVEHGYQGTSISMIAKKAGVSVGSVYSYFKNKEDLLICVMEDIGNQVRHLAGVSFLNVGFSMEGIKAAGVAFFEEFCMKYPGRVSLLWDDSIGQGSQFRKARRVFFEKIIMDVKGALDEVRESQGLEVNHSMTPEILAVCIAGAYERVGWHYPLWKKNPEELKIITQETVAFIVAGMKSLMKEKI